MKINNTDPRYVLLMQEWIEKHDNAIKEAKSNGTYEAGLDGNRSLFTEIDKAMMIKMRDLMRSTENE